MARSSIDPGLSLLGLVNGLMGLDDGLGPSLLSFCPGVAPTGLDGREGDGLLGGYWALLGGVGAGLLTGVTP